MNMGAYWKDILREIKKTVGRFFSLIIIALLGATAIVGIQATSIDMRAIADKTYKEENLYDIQIKSTTGFDNDDISALKGAAGVHTVMPSYAYDTFIYINNGQSSSNETLTVRTYSLPGELNKIKILDGRLPQNDKECAVESDLLNYGNYKIGDTITLGLDNMDDYYNVFDNNIFTIVGVVSSPFYVSLERGNTSLGDGRLDFYLYLSPETYKLDVFTDVYILMNGSQDMDNLTDGYNNSAEEWKKTIKLTGDIRVQAKKDEYAQNQKDIDDGWAEYYKNKQDFETLKIQASATQVELNNKYGEMERLYNEKVISWEDFYQFSRQYSETMKSTDLEIYKAETKLDDAKAKLEESQKKLDNAPVPEWFYFTRKDGVAYDSYYQDTLRLEKIGYVFPLIFFLVAILVSLTTMSRMVEEHRTQIGVYKALGYKSFKIIIKYLFYAFASSAIGGIIGVVVGSNLFPRIISDAYGHLYDMPPVETPIPLEISLIAVISSVSVVMLVTAVTCIGSMTNSPAELMRPKSPPDGKRVLIEKIPFIWNRFNFFAKVTARNIFRYKKRFIMTLIGVAGCSALLLTGFGLRDSIGGVGNLQYEKVMKYSSRAYLKDITSEEQRSELDALLSGLSGKYLYIREESVTVGGFSTSLIVPEKPLELRDFINLRNRKTGDVIPFASGDVEITEKLAREMGVSASDMFEITANGGKTYATRIIAIVENYVHHYVYMSPDVYKELFGEEPVYNSILAVTDNNKEFAQKLLADDNVRAVVNTDDVRKHINDSTDALKIVTVVLIILACALAFVVLFNLTNINITERIRELATIKVLGFYNTELAMYIYRENGIVTAMGIILGLIGGIWLNGFVLTQVEIDLLMFPHTIEPQSYIYSILLSVVFAVFVNIVMGYKLGRIDMVESLKSIE